MNISLETETGDLFIGMEHMATTEILDYVECDCDHCFEGELIDSFEGDTFTEDIRLIIILTIVGTLAFLVMAVLLVICVRRIIMGKLVTRRLSIIEENIGQMTRIKNEDLYE